MNFLITAFLNEYNAMKKRKKLISLREPYHVTKTGGRNRVHEHYSGGEASH